MKYFIAKIKIKTILIVLAALFFIISIFYFWPNKKTKIIKLGQTSVQVEVADEYLERYQGLSGRKELCSKCGMIFVFSDSASRTFSMRGMNLPLDFIWINKGVVVGIDAMVYPASDKEVLINGPESSHVLEVNGGFAKSYDIKAGDRIDL